MGWADFHIASLREGKTVQFRPHGNSMQGRVEATVWCESKIENRGWKRR